VRNKYWMVLSALIMAAFGWVVSRPLPAAAQVEGEPVVFAVLFYSPTCGHCHKVITEDLPVIEEEFGDQFQVLFVNIAAEGGNQLYHAAVEAFEVPLESRGVPLMIIGTHVMIGDLQIPQEAPVLVREGLASGGIGLPAVPGLEESYQQALAQATQQAAGGSESAEAAPTEEAQAAPTESAQVAPTEAAQAAPAAEQPNPGPAGAVVETEVSGEEASEVNTTLASRLARDPLGNGLAVGVLLALTASAGAIVITGLRGPSPWLAGEVGWRLTLACGVLALAVSLTLLGGSADDGMLGLLMALGTTICLAAAVGLVAARRMNLAVLLAALAGLCVAAYMTYVEVSQMEAVCGVVGDCNTVQQSQYANLFGVLSIGVLGVMGFLAILFAWVVSWSANPTIAGAARVALFGMASFGVLFSIYLTFLEPFVIGATCAWCLTSALVMMLLFWLAAPAGWQVIQGDRTG
jgi:uncharacterized membrane protein